MRWYSVKSFFCNMLLYVIKYALTKYVHVSHHVVHFLYVDATIAENIYSVVCISRGRRQGWVSWLIWAERNSGKKCPISNHLTLCPLDSPKRYYIVPPRKILSSVFVPSWDQHWELLSQKNLDIKQKYGAHKKGRLDRTCKLKTLKWNITQLWISHS